MALICRISLLKLHRVVSHRGLLQAVKARLLSLLSFVRADAWVLG